MDISKVGDLWAIKTQDVVEKVFQLPSEPARIWRECLPSLLEDEAAHSVSHDNRLEEAVKKLDEILARKH